jgi:galactose mutarotase-like enzyme
LEPGRYANRIKNSTFNIDGVDYHVDANENGGRNTLHGGSDGWDFVSRALKQKQHCTVLIQMVVAQFHRRRLYGGLHYL